MDGEDRNYGTSVYFNAARLLIYPDAAPDGYYGGCGDGGYESGAASSSSSDGGGGAGGFGGGEHSVIGGGSASCCTGSRPGVPRSAGEGAGL